MTADSNLRIDGKRLWDSLMDMAKIGATPKGGVNRLTLTDLDRQSRDLFGDWCRKAGCSISIDHMGSMFARRAGADDSLPPVLIGSHLDTQPTGGKFDGALGVMAALEVVRSLNDLDIKTRHPIEICMWTNEEGSRFAPAMIASGVFAGVIPLDEALATRDPEGKVFGEELDRIGYSGPEKVGGRPIHALFELHIEQGPILEEEGIEIGIVTAANGQKWYEITLTGVESHAGPTPMNRRKDALLGASRTVELVNKIGHDHDPSACATCGMVEVYPNSRNVIPGRVFVTVDFRHPDGEKLISMDKALRKGLEEIAARTGVTAEIKMVADFPPQPFEASCVTAVRNAASKLGYTTRDITSGAGHDAVYVARVAPAAMIFTPCIGGISHNEAEDMTPEWAAAGTDVLLHAVLEKAEVVSGKA
ncbi:Zn-dependent hydrolase [Hyphomicrobium sp. CS1BSMeth3]|uniref:Zn-dependent hydrolase n=1 Tax=Hyphomicrobium sp. CS1BSMeth3 TaxID=1892844 RepID=UPI000931470C|nr:Zn-dependent hydrolase [Hyphomicrobium sp. CS1BSMeth3]